MLHGSRVLPGLVVAVLLAGTLTSCLAVPGKTDRVVKIDSTDVDGWHFDYYRNLARPATSRRSPSRRCSASTPRG